VVLSVDGRSDGDGGWDGEGAGVGAAATARGGAEAVAVDWDDLDVAERLDGLWKGSNANVMDGRL
jgi:hypothetical protein